MEGRKGAILFAEGSDKMAIDKLKAYIEGAGGTPFLVAPKVGGIKVKGGTLKADGQLAGSPSVLFDAVASILTEEQAKALSVQGARSAARRAGHECVSTCRSRWSPYT